jgi:hypothetical protein
LLASNSLHSLPRLLFSAATQIRETHNQHKKRARQGVGRSAMLPLELEPARVLAWHIDDTCRANRLSAGKMWNVSVLCGHVWGRDLLSLGASANFASPDRQQPPSHAAREHRQNVPGTLRRSLSKARNPRGEGFRFRAGPRTFPIPSRSRKAAPTFGEDLRKAAACQIHHFDNVNVTCVLCRWMG